MKIKAAVVREYNKPVAVEEIDLAPPKANEVLVRTAYTGFCHSDLTMLGGSGNMPLPGCPATRRRAWSKMWGPASPR